jgi:predicted  nucleic acid-binding Zn-ribbon protein
MKCIKCGKEYEAGAHYCAHCGAITAEGEMSLALTDFAKAAKQLVRQTAKIGGKHLKEIKPDINQAIKQVVEAGNEMKNASKPAAKTGLEAARTALQLAAQAAENMAAQLRKASKKR